MSGNRIIPVLTMICLGTLLWAAPLAAQDREPVSSGQVELASEPAGAEVFVGDSLIGNTPVRASRALLPKVTVWFPARDAWNAQVLRPDTAGPSAEQGVLLLRFSARAMLTGTSMEGDAPGVHVGEATDYGSAFRLPGADILLPAGLGLAAGIAAVMLKQYADGLYDDYLRSGDASLLSQAEKYDIYAGVSLLLLQAGLGYFVFRLFDE